MRLYENLLNSEVSSGQQGVLTGEDQRRSILIIGGIHIFLPNNQVEARACVAGAATEGQPTRTTKEEEKEKILKSSPVEEEEHSEEWFKIFSKEVEQEVTTTLESAAEEEACSMDFTDLCGELEALERRVIVKSMHIQQVKLEIDGGVYQPGEKLEETGTESTPRKLAENNLLREMVEQQFSEETAELKSAVEWKFSITGEEDSMRGQYNLSFHQQKEEMQQNNLHEGRSQPTEQLDRVIEQIRRLMLRSAQEAVSKEKLNKGEPAIVVGRRRRRRSRSNNNKAEEQVDISKKKFGIQVDFNIIGELMSSS
jgi:hypothetical protein